MSYIREVDPNKGSVCSKGTLSWEGEVKPLAKEFALFLQKIVATESSFALGGLRGLKRYLSKFCFNTQYHLVSAFPNSSTKKNKVVPGMKSLTIPSSENMTGFSDTSRPNFSHACHLLNIFFISTLVYACHLLNIFLYLSITFCCKA